ncbi:MAG: undecaprenyl-diphosphate phosphatase [Candidatus Ranarchaeia archaeon]
MRETCSLSESTTVVKGCAVNLKKILPFTGNYAVFGWGVIVALDLVSVVILAIIQGVIEWWPISSEGQLTLFLVNVVTDPVNVISLAILLHLGTMFVVLYVFRSRYLRLVSTPIDKWLWKFLFITSIGTGLTGVPLLIFVADLVQQAEASLVSIFVGLLLIGTGVILWRSNHSLNPSETRDINQISNLELLCLGFVQGLAILPGISRSGMTIALLLARKVDKKQAITGSFLISVPTIIGAVLIDLLRGGLPSLLGVADPIILMIGLVITFLTGFVSIKALLKLATKTDFAVLCWILGTIIVLVEITGWFITSIAV